jgi:hypothetical protein
MEDNKPKTLVTLLRLHKMTQTTEPAKVDPVASKETSKKKIEEDELVSL